MALFDTFTLEVISQVDPAVPVPTIEYTLGVGEPETTLFDAMNSLQAQPISGFTFESEEYLDFGHYVTKINGLKEEKSQSLFWIIYIDQLEDPATEGIDFLIPEKDQKYIFAYTYSPLNHPEKIKK